MLVTIHIIFWIAFFLTLYPYGIYPLLVWSLAKLLPHPRESSPCEPTVTAIVPAHNEATVIARRIENLLGLDYPKEKLQIIIVSDGSTDDTNDIVACYANRGVQLVALPEQQGKTAAQNEAMKSATGEIILFTDSSTIMEPKALRILLRNFADLNVGCVGGMVRLTDTGESSGEEQMGLYLRMEHALRLAEGSVWTTSGLSGCFYGIRHELVTPMDERRQVDDVVSALRTVAAGKRVVYERDAWCVETIEVDSSAGFNRRIRSSLGGLTTLFSMPELLNPLRHPVLSLQLISHKICRNILFPVLMVALVTNVLLVGTKPVYAALLLMQSLAWAAVFVGGWGWRTGPCPLLYAFIQQHVASAVALWRLVRGRHGEATKWKTQ